MEDGACEWDHRVWTDVVCFLVVRIFGTGLDPFWKVFLYVVSNTLSVKLFRMIMYIEYKPSLFNGGGRKPLLRAPSIVFIKLQMKSVLRTSIVFRRPCDCWCRDREMMCGAPAPTSRCVVASPADTRGQLAFAVCGWALCVNYGITIKLCVLTMSSQ